jgi:hypothetical protein
MINGNYYMAGDSGCVQGNSVSSNSIQCFDRKGNFTEYRNALSYEQIANYQIQTQQLNQQMQQTGQTFQNAGQQILQQSQQYTPPQVQPITPQGTGTTFYRRTGNTWMGSDGSSCQIIGQSIACSDGKRCQLVGENLICN